VINVWSKDVEVTLDFLMMLAELRQIVVVGHGSTMEN